MKQLAALSFMVFFVQVLCFSQNIISEAPLFVENGVLKSTRITVAFNQNVISTESGVTLVDTLRHPIRNTGVKALLRLLSTRYGPFTIRKIIPRAVWGDTLVRNKRNGRFSRVPDLSQSFSIAFSQPMPIDSVENLLRALPAVKYAERPVSIGLATTDPYFSQQWNLQTIKAEQAWNITFGFSALSLLAGFKDL